MIDYMLTVATSVASGCDAIFSSLPRGWAAYKVGSELIVIGVLILTDRSSELLVE